MQLSGGLRLLDTIQPLLGGVHFLAFNAIDVEREDEWRGVNLTRFPVNVFNTKRYFNPKAHLAAKDPYRMTTPVSHKIDDWAVKYGTK